MNYQSTDQQSDLDEFLGQPPEDGQRKRKILVIAGVAVLAVLLLLSWWAGSGPTGQRYATAPVVRGDMTVQVTATGNLEPTNEVSVGSELSGLIDGVMVDVNDRVTRGQPLAQIDTDKLMDAIRRSQASLQQARASVAQAQASVEQSRAALARQEEVLRLSGGKVPSEADLDAARAQYERDRANLASARASVVAAEAQLATDRTNLSKATIRSPVDGVILSRQIEPGQTVAASFNTPTLFVIAEDLTQMKLEVKVDEADVGQVRQGQKATFTVDAYPGKTFGAHIARVNVGSNLTATGGTSSTATTAGSSSSVVSYGAVLTVNNGDLALRPGMTATANIVTSERTNVLMVPNAALRFEPRRGSGAGEQPGFSMFPPGRRGDRMEQEVGIGRGSTQTVHVLDTDGALRPIQVRVGDNNGAQTIVTGDGLKAGMKVVTGELAQGQ